MTDNARRLRFKFLDQRHHLLRTLLSPEINLGPCLFHLLDCINASGETECPELTILCTRKPSSNRIFIKRRFGQCPMDDPCRVPQVGRGLLETMNSDFTYIHDCPQLPSHPLLPRRPSSWQLEHRALQLDTVSLQPVRPIRQVE